MGDRSAVVKDGDGGILARLNHPVIGVFIASSVVWNWEAFYYIIRGLATPQATIEIVHSGYFYWGNWPNLILIPVVLTVLFLASGPALREGYDRYQEWVHAYSKKISPVAQYELDSVRNNLSRSNENLAKELSDSKMKFARSLIEAEEKLKNSEATAKRNIDALNLANGGRVNLYPHGIISTRDLIVVNQNTSLELGNEKEKNKKNQEKIKMLEAEIAELKDALYVKNNNI